MGGLENGTFGFDFGVLGEDPQKRFRICNFSNVRKCVLFYYISEVFYALRQSP